MYSSFDGILMIVNNRGKPTLGCGKNEREVQEFMDFETRNAGISSSFLQILEKKL